MQARSRYEQTLADLRVTPRRWLITGVAGFIGSNLLECLIRHGQNVTGLDNFSTGHRHNLDQVRALVSAEQWSRFRFIEGDVREPAVCRQACEDIDYVLHQAALGSVPRSLADPITTNAVNVSGFLNMMVAAQGAGVRRVVYAASSSTYGDHPGLPKVEALIGKPLSPYAVTKYVNELYADVFARCYGIESIGLRYFNVFGPRQDPEGAYAAVIPKWSAAILRGEAVYINGDGKTSRDFCFVDNAVQANVLAATATDERAVNQVYNVALGDETTLTGLYELLQERLGPRRKVAEVSELVYRGFRDGDVRHSRADISKAAELLGYAPTHRIASGLDATADWYVHSL